VRAALVRRGIDSVAVLDRVLELDERWRALTAELEQLRAEQNRASRGRQGAPSEEERRQLAELAARGRSLSDEELSERLRPFLPDLPESTIRAATPALKERLPRLAKAADLLAYLREPPPAPELDESAHQMVAAAGEALFGTEWTPEAIDKALEGLREERGWSKGKFFGTIRRCVAGGDTPPIHHMLALLPKAEALARLDRVLA